ncbi:CKLF-like MARVEL transmembrane domain-containing protein 6 [Callorhinchus milii]|uniref:CKLF-like MARVEL transmembrane domain-containing protein 6-like protein n=1 Tax=Callorhinchus milii TaxID=7868 RepID=V9KL70_CALMI|nr:CKLF-like MARVEL transmembrane domain-containing protein 6 [Callorhinchus milii]|eukprot:gi/632959661/ref/XP_007895752.1/ PREDICTED: CKLF-like MARVEL transmembrane domain-containing protein 6 [Callorhinchus milii]
MSGGHENGDVEALPNVYQATTESLPAQSWLRTSYLRSRLGLLKLAEVVLSLLAFILEELVQNCLKCNALYFFEFVSCSAFLLTLLLLLMMATSLMDKLDRVNWQKVDFFYTALIALLFLLASIVFAALNDGTGLEQASVAFGFLATIAFIVDTVLQYKERNIFFKQKEADPQKSGEAAKPPESEPLNENPSA